MFKSKRFIATVASGIVFVIGVFFFHSEPVALASGIGIILAPYLAAETFSRSNVDQSIKNKI